MQQEFIIIYKTYSLNGLLNIILVVLLTFNKIAFLTRFIVLITRIESHTTIRVDNKRLCVKNLIHIFVSLLKHCETFAQISCPLWFAGCASLFHCNSPCTAMNWVEFFYFSLTCFFFFSILGLLLNLSQTLAFDYLLAVIFSTQERT